MDSSIQSYGDMAMSQAAPSTPSASMTAGFRSGANIDKTSQDFEAMFMTQMLQPMFDGVGNDPTFGGGHGEEVMKTFMLQEYGKIIAKSGQIGIASTVKNEMIKAQAIAENAKTGKGKSNAAIQ